MSLTISRVLHAGLIFEGAGTRVLFDPIFEVPFGRNCHAYPAVTFDYDRLARERFDAVVISHYHDDHCSFESLHRIARDTPVYLYCVHAEMFRMIRRLGFREVRQLELDRAIEVGAIRVTARRAFDADVDCLLHVECGGINILNVVDALLDDDSLGDLARVRWDLILWPFQTMREVAVLAPSLAEPASTTVPPEFITQLRALRPRAVVPGACQFRFEPWSWMNHWYFPISYGTFAREVEAGVPGASVRRLDPGRALSVDADTINEAEALPWVRLTSAAPVDYDFDPSVPPTPTSEIARQFADPDHAARARLEDFCRRGLVRRYQSPVVHPAEYFGGLRRWRLFVVAADGTGVTYDYVIHGPRIRRVTAHAGEPDWITEVIAAKLWSALEHGEALNSLYLRVARAPPGSDPLEDPLIRILYSGRFGGYQRAQLRGIDSRA